MLAWQAVIADCDDGACPDGNDECDDKCNVGFLTWFALFILVVLIIAGIVFAILYVTENPLVMGGEKRRGTAFVIHTACPVDLQTFPRVAPAFCV
jgi:hypothetical protein